MRASIPVLLALSICACRVDASSRQEAAAVEVADRAAGGATLHDGSSGDVTLRGNPIDTLSTDGGEVRMAPIRRHVLVQEDSLWHEALRIHYNAIVIDGHVDLPTKMVDEGYDMAVRHPAYASHVDVPRMVEGGLDAAFFSIYVAHHYGEGARSVHRARRQIAEVRRQLAAAPDRAALALTADDVRRITRSGRKAVLLGLEGGNALSASVDTLEALYAEGIRYVTLTHVNNNSWAESSQSPPRLGGLNALGRTMVERMNRLGVVVDLSHVSDGTFYDALEVSVAPVMLSHSSARDLVDNVRNVDDAMLRALADNGGIAMVNFFDAVVNPHLNDSLMAEAYRRLGGREGSLNDLWTVVYALKREGAVPGASLSDVVDHIDHVAQVAGVDHVGLGSDFDGVFDLPGGLQDVTRLPWITYELLKRGYAEEDLYKILGGNALRVLEDVERVAAGS